MKKRIISLLVIAMLILSIVPAAFAASVPQYFIDTAKTASLNIYKIDFTNAYKDGVWTEDSFVSTGWRESYVEDTLINEPSRKGTSSNDSTLGNGETSHGYAIKGVEFTYLKVADPPTSCEVGLVARAVSRRSFNFNPPTSCEVGRRLAQTTKTHERFQSTHLLRGGTVRYILA